MNEAKAEIRTSEAIRNIRTAMLLFLLEVKIFGFDILPDFIGWLCLIKAVDILAGKAEGIERIRGFGRILLWYEVLLVVMNYIEIPFVDRIIPYAGIFTLSIRIYFMYIILTAAADVSAAEGGGADTIKGVCRSRNRVLLAELAVYLFAAIQGVEQIGGWLYVPTVLYFLFYLICILHLIGLKEEVEAWEQLHSGKETNLTEIVENP